MSERTLSDIPCQGARIEHKACSVRKDSIVNVGVLDYRSCVVPFAVNYEPEAQQDRCNDEGLERGGGCHRIVSDARCGDCFGDGNVSTLRVACGEIHTSIYCNIKQVSTAKYHTRSREL